MGDKLVFGIKAWLREKVWLWVWGTEWQPVLNEDINNAQKHLGSHCPFCENSFTAKQMREQGK